MASSEGNYHRRGPYIDGTNFASWKQKMKIHILVQNDTSIWHHAFIFIFIALWDVITHYIIILMHILSYIIRFT